MYTPHYYVNFSGTIGTEEVWSCGFRARDRSGELMDSGQLDAYVSGISGQVQVEFATGEGFIPSGVALTALKINAIDQSGHYRDPTTHLFEWDPGVRSAVGATLPSFCCAAATLRTAVKRGRAHAGRIYWPNYGVPLAGYEPPTVNAQAQNGIAVFTRNMMRAACVQYGAGGLGDVVTLVPIVASKLDGAVHDVTGIDVGTVIDYISRRKNAYQEAYSHLPYTT